jgi:hypothetical protein
LWLGVADGYRNFYGVDISPFYRAHFGLSIFLAALRSLCAVQLKDVENTACGSRLSGGSDGCGPGSILHLLVGETRSSLTRVEYAAGTASGTAKGGGHNGAIMGRAKDDLPRLGERRSVALTRRRAAWRYPCAAWARSIAAGCCAQTSLRRLAIRLPSSLRGSQRRRLPAHSDLAAATRRRA